MRLLIDSVPVRSGGLLQLRDELSKAAARHAPSGSSVTLLAASRSDDSGKTDNLTVVSLPRPRWGWLGRWWWYNRALPRLAQRHEADVVYSLSGILTANTVQDVGGVTSVNNMVPFSPADMAHLRPWSRARLRLSILRRLYVSALRRADAVVLHSRNALDLVTPYAGEISSKTFVALTGVPSDLEQASAAARSHPEGGRPYLLYFSAFYPYKNHVRLIEAYRESLLVEPDLPDLVLAGMPMDRAYFEEVMKTVADQGLGTRIRYVGALSRSDIALWISNALINFFPSTCETNPVTVAEILGLGAVLACSTSPPMPEIVGNDAAAYFDPRSVASMSQAIVGLYRDPVRRTQLRERGRERAAALSWDECGIQMWRAAHAARVGYEQRSARSHNHPNEAERRKDGGSRW